MTKGGCEGEMFGFITNTQRTDFWSGMSSSNAAWKWTELSNIRSENKKVEKAVKYSKDTLGKLHL